MSRNRHTAAFLITAALVAALTGGTAAAGGHLVWAGHTAHACQVVEVGPSCSVSTGRTFRPEPTAVLVWARHNPAAYAAGHAGAGRPSAGASGHDHLIWSGQLSGAYAASRARSRPGPLAQQHRGR